MIEPIETFWNLKKIQNLIAKVLMTFDDSEVYQLFDDLSKTLSPSDEIKQIYMGNWLDFML